MDLEGVDIQTDTFISRIMPFKLDDDAIIRINTDPEHEQSVKTYNQILTSILNSVADLVVPLSIFDAICYCFGYMRLYQHGVEVKKTTTVIYDSTQENVDMNDYEIKITIEGDYIYNPNKITVNYGRYSLSRTTPVCCVYRDNPDAVISIIDNCKMLRNFTSDGVYKRINKGAK